MKQTIIFYTITIFAFLISNIQSAFSATDTLYLYEDGIQMTTDNVIVGHGELKTKCQNGVCVIDQQTSRDLLFYKLPETTNILTRYQWFNNALEKDKTCKDVIEKNANDAPGIEDCAKKYSVANYVRYVNSSLKVVEYSASIKIPAAQNTGITDRNIMLPKIGKDRCFNADLKTKIAQEMYCETAVNP